MSRLSIPPLDMDFLLYEVSVQRGDAQIVFSVIQRKVIKPADFNDLDALAQRLVAFEARYNTTTRPFDWTFTHADLLKLCRRIDAHCLAA